MLRVLRRWLHSIGIDLELEIRNWKFGTGSGSSGSIKLAKKNKTKGLTKIIDFPLKQYRGIVFLVINSGNFDKTVIKSRCLKAIFNSIKFHTQKVISNLELFLGLSKG